MSALRHARTHMCLWTGAAVQQWCAAERICMEQCAEWTFGSHVCQSVLAEWRWSTVWITCVTGCFVSTKASTPTSFNLSPAVGFILNNWHCDWNFKWSAFFGVASSFDSICTEGTFNAPKSPLNNCLWVVHLQKPAEFSFLKESWNLICVLICVSTKSQFASMIHLVWAQHLSECLLPHMPNGMCSWQILLPRFLFGTMVQSSLPVEWLHHQSWDRCQFGVETDANFSHHSIPVTMSQRVLLGLVSLSVLHAHVTFCLDSL